jgi:hypothetical protein
LQWHCLPVRLNLPRFPLAATSTRTRCGANTGCACSPRLCRSRCAPGWCGASFDGKETIQAAYRQRPGEAELFGIHPHTLGLMALTELKVSRSVVEAPIASISRETRNRLLASQGAFLQRIYSALGATGGAGPRAGSLSAGDG